MLLFFCSYSHRIKFDDQGVVLSGDIKVVFYVRDAKKKILQFWFNTMVLNDAKRLFGEMF